MCQRAARSLTPLGQPLLLHAMPSPLAFREDFLPERLHAIFSRTSRRLVADDEYDACRYHHAHLRFAESPL